MDVAKDTCIRASLFEDQSKMGLYVGCPRQSFFAIIFVQTRANF